MSRFVGCLIAAAMVGGCAAPVEPEEVAPVAPGPAAVEPPNVEKPAESPAPGVVAAPVGSVDLTELFGLVESGRVLLLDIRPPLFHNLSHIPGSIGLSRKKYAEWIVVEEARIREAADSGRDVVLYCANLECPDASAVAADLSKLRIPVKVFHGGWDEWKAAGLPSE